MGLTWARLAVGLTVGLSAATASAAEFEWTWTPGSGEGAVTAHVSTFLYGKRWAYAVELDDGNVDAFTGAEPLLAAYEFSDAPPGVAGGSARRFVGTAAIFPYRISGNDSYLSWEQIATLLSNGWGIANHSYFHQGTPDAPLTAEGYARELYWSQQVIGVLALGGRATSHMVYPNGDTHYADIMLDYGVNSGSRVGGTSSVDLGSASLDLTDFPRNYLDEGYWTNWGSSDAKYGLPGAEPGVGSLILDFTHNVDPNTGSANHQRWVARLDYLASTFGKDGNDSLWCAPSTAVFDYAAAAKVAAVEAGSGTLRVTIRDDIAGSPLTIELDGVAEDAVVTAPEGGVLYRSGTKVWLTTPLIGQAGVALPGPALKRVYSGPVSEVTLDAPQEIAGVRLHQMGEAPAEFSFDVILEHPDASTEVLASATPGAGWGVWHVFDALPGKDAVLASKVRLSATHESFEALEVWAIDPDASVASGGTASSGGSSGTGAGGAPGSGGAAGASGGVTASGGSATSSGRVTGSGGSAAASGGASARSAAATTSDDSGCGCRSAGARPAAWGWFLVALGLVALERRPRRSRRRSSATSLSSSAPIR